MMSDFDVYKSTNSGIYRRESISQSQHQVIDERKKIVEKERCKRRAYQVMIILLSALKMYFISVMQGEVTMFSHLFNENEYSLRMAFIFGYVLVGNIVDNLAKPKILAIIL